MGDVRLKGLAPGAVVHSPPLDLPRGRQSEIQARRRHRDRSSPAPAPRPSAPAVRRPWGSDNDSLTAARTVWLRCTSLKSLRGGGVLGGVGLGGVQPHPSPPPPPPRAEENRWPKQRRRRQRKLFIGRRPAGESGPITLGWVGSGGRGGGAGGGLWDPPPAPGGAEVSRGVLLTPPLQRPFLRIPATPHYPNRPIVESGGVHHLLRGA